mmetsp:Transcript_11150/g.32936  ORF Transcript_11150/g.32936 Transcript_11150/m.32936 type:complete len:410 (+) Transcript_11150:890-2119(+)
MVLHAELLRLLRLGVGQRDSLGPPKVIRRRVVRVAHLGAFHGRARQRRVQPPGALAPDRLVVGGLLARSGREEGQVEGALGQGGGLRRAPPHFRAAPLRQPAVGHLVPVCLGPPLVLRDELVPALHRAHVFLVRLHGRLVDLLARDALGLGLALDRPARRPGPRGGCLGSLRVFVLGVVGLQLAFRVPLELVHRLLLLAALLRDQEDPLLLLLADLLLPRDAPCEAILDVDVEALAGLLILFRRRAAPRVEGLDLLPGPRDLVDHAEGVQLRVDLGVHDVQRRAAAARPAASRRRGPAAVRRARLAVRILGHELHVDAVRGSLDPAPVHVDHLLPLRALLVLPLHHGLVEGPAHLHDFVLGLLPLIVVLAVRHLCHVRFAASPNRLSRYPARFGIGAAVRPRPAPRRSV